MKIFFIGSVIFSRSCLLALIENKYDIVGVCTKKTSSFNSDHFDLKSICQENSIPVLYTDNINSDIAYDFVKDKKPDVIYCFGWSSLIKDKLLELSPKGVIGFHPTNLPENRGRHPLIWTLALGLKSSATTFFKMNKYADKGVIISQKIFKININDNAHSLYKKVTEIAVNQILEFTPKLSNNTIVYKVQNERKSNYWRKRTFSDGEIKWTMNASNIYNLIRALSKPYPGAHFNYNGQIIKIWNSKILNKHFKNIEPGKIIFINNGNIVVQTGEMCIEIIEMEIDLKFNVGQYL